MLAISEGTVLETLQDFVDATKQIPAFTASCAIIMWIWHTYAVWCRRYGLEDGITIFKFESDYISFVIHLPSKFDNTVFVSNHK
jgi:hypothetical protein